MSVNHHKDSTLVKNAPPFPFLLTQITQTITFLRIQGVKRFPNRDHRDRDVAPTIAWSSRACSAFSSCAEQVEAIHELPLLHIEE